MTGGPGEEGVTPPLMLWVFVPPARPQPLPDPTPGPVLSHGLCIPAPSSCLVLVAASSRQGDLVRTAAAGGR